VCGIVSVVQGEDGREPVPLASLVEELEATRTSLPFDGVERITACTEHLEQADGMLRGVRGVVTLAQDPGASALVRRLGDEVWHEIEAFESRLDSGAMVSTLEDVNTRLSKLKDAVWRIRNDALRIASDAFDLAGRDVGRDALVAFGQIAIALSAIDRLEVRGRDSAGLAVVVRSHGLDLGNPATRQLVDEHTTDPLFGSTSVRVYEDKLCFAYKAAAEVGELGDNTRAIRDAIRDDGLLHVALQVPGARALVLGHTRWASVGMISEANTHPLASDEAGHHGGPVVVAVLNGDIDNHADITEAEGLQLPLEVTTDAKIIPVLIAKRLREGLDLEEAFRRTVASFDGSVAIAAVSLQHPDRVLLALRGSGQALYAGLGEGAFVVASEPYGFIEQAATYVRMDGDEPADPSDPKSRGQIVVVAEAANGDLQRLERFDYNGTTQPVRPNDIRRAEITTRDVDRGPYPHFLIKELYESPSSFRKTLRGRLSERDGRLRCDIGPDALPSHVMRSLADGSTKRIVVMGQGTAAIAGRAVAAALTRALEPLPVRIEAQAATELSGFGLTEDMSDTLLVVISQSGTTTDTNRTVEVAKARGASAIAIVNRRHSDLTDRVDGALYTSDGRDVEMAVPSTKAFYSQVAAGFLLAAALGERLDGAAGVDQSLLAALRDLPDAMEHVLAKRTEIAEIVQRHVLRRRDWAVVGNGPNRIAAEEVRIKLSELCYKSISSDVTEDKKHIDLSAEPLILVCGAGLEGSNAEDIAKEVAIYRAHKAAPIVICSEGGDRFEAALDVIRVPSVHPGIAFVLSAMAGHLFGYEAALAIDAQARTLREARAAVEAASSGPQTNGHDAIRVLELVRPGLLPLAARFNEALRAGNYDGHLGPSTAVRIASLFRYVTGVSSLDEFQIEHGKIGTPYEVLADFMDALTAGIDELTRPIDAIRHQAKTVTVGITRAEETLLQGSLVREVLATGVARDRLSYGTLRALAALDAAVDRVTGYTHYAIEGDVAREAQVRITDRGGIARDIPTRTERDPRLRGTKHRVAVEREILVTRGHDGRSLVIVPETKGPDVTGIALLHVRFHDVLPPDVVRGVLQGYRDRYSALRDIVTETEPTFRDDLLGEIGVESLLIDSIQALALRWRTES
jgi:glucosamine--fructose-6-phosphate aminotransferase (isomerizing)